MLACQLTAKLDTIIPPPPGDSKIIAQEDHNQALYV